MKVERSHKPKFEIIPLDEWLEPSKRRIKKIPLNILKRRDSLLSFSELYIGFSRWLTWETQTPEIETESATGLRYASKMYAAFLQLAMQPEQDLTFKIYDLPEVTWNGQGMLEAGRAHPGQWLEAYFLAVITRDTESQDSLADFPVSIMKQSATQADPVLYSLVEVFQAYHHRAADYPKRLINTTKELSADGDDWSLSIGMGYLETFAALTTDVGYDFNDTLAKNLRIQEQYYINENGPDRVPVESFLPLQLLGMACMWHDMGNEVSVESDSLPRFLIDGRYVK